MFCDLCFFSCQIGQSSASGESRGPPESRSGVRAGQRGPEPAELRGDGRGDVHGRPGNAQSHDRLPGRLCALGGEAHGHQCSLATHWGTREEDENALYCTVAISRPSAHNLEFFLVHILVESLFFKQASDTLPESLWESSVLASKFYATCNGKKMSKVGALGFEIATVR